MKHNILYEDVKFEQVSLLDEACKIYPNLSEVRKKAQTLTKILKKCMKKCVESLRLNVGA